MPQEHTTLANTQRYFKLQATQLTTQQSKYTQQKGTNSLYKNNLQRRFNRKPHHYTYRINVKKVIIHPYNLL